MAVTSKKARFSDIDQLAEAANCLSGETDFYPYFSEDENNSSESSSLGTTETWWAIPEPILLKIFSVLSVRDIINASKTCTRWNLIAEDNMLWKQKFHEHYQTEANISLKPGATSWRSEYIRLAQNIPFVQAQRLEGHTHQVLHVSFAHNGEVFATCSKDGYVIVWHANHPCTEKYSHNMKTFSWKYTQYSQFNQSDTLLLVSGVHFGSPHSTSGEIAVFALGKTESHLRCRVVNRPYDIFGTWFSDEYLISGDLHWLAHLVSTSVLWLNKANQETDSEHVPIMNQLYKFYNRNASSVRAIMIAKCPWLDETNDPLPPVASSVPSSSSSALKISGTESDSNGASSSSSAGNPLSHSASLRRHQRNDSPENFLLDIREQSTSRGCTIKLPQSMQYENVVRPSSSNSTIHYLDEYRREYKGEQDKSNCEIDVDVTDGENDEDVESDEPMDTADEYDEMENGIPKYLIYSTGSKTYTPHQIGIKRIRNVYFPKKLDPGPTLKERIAARRAAVAAAAERAHSDPDWWDYDSVADRFDKADKVIDLHGHIIGMALSPDHRYLYVNTRPWPKNYVISNALEPPPIAQEIDIHVIDLMTLKRVGNMLHAHKAYTSSTECFFIFLDVCNDYVASGAEDHHAYLWDRYYGVSLAKYRHSDVVNSVAFNPQDPEMLVTTSDDYSIKVWRSRAKAAEYNISPNVSDSYDLKASK